MYFILYFVERKHNVIFVCAGKFARADFCNSRLKIGELMSTFFAIRHLPTLARVNCKLIDRGVAEMAIRMSRVF